MHVIRYSEQYPIIHEKKKCDKRDSNAITNSICKIMKKNLRTLDLSTERPSQTERPLIPDEAVPSSTNSFEGDAKADQSRSSRFTQMPAVFQHRHNAPFFPTFAMIGSKQKTIVAMASVRTLPAHIRSISPICR